MVGTPSLVPCGTLVVLGPSWQLQHCPGPPQQDCPSTPQCPWHCPQPTHAPRALPVPSVSLLWTVCWRRCLAARCGSVLVCRGSWRALVLCSAPSSPAWGGGVAVRTLRGSRSGGVGGTGPGGRVEPSRLAEPWRPGYPAKTAAPSPSAAGIPRLPLAPGWGSDLHSQTQVHPPHYTPAFGVSLKLSLCCGGFGVTLPAAEPHPLLLLRPACPVRWGLGRRMEASM